MVLYIYRFSMNPSPRGEKKKKAARCNFRTGVFVGARALGAGCGVGLDWGKIYLLDLGGDFPRA